MKGRSLKGENDRPRIRFLSTYGRKIINGIDHLGAALIFFGRSLSMIFQLKQIPRIVEQIFFIGAKTVNIVALIGFFTGMVLALQLYHSLVKFGSETVLGSAVALALVRELGPVLTAVMIIARAGSSMTAEIGVMRISEQIDALYTMRIDPLRYLVSPRIAASIISFPLLTAWFDIIGLIGGYFTGVMLLGVNAGAYIHRVHASVEIQDVCSGFVKALVFAAIVSTICCYQGYFTHLRPGSHGARSVSLSTTSAVVLSCVGVLIADYVVTSIML